ncbi:hypothetical protein MNV_560043 [Candidatus Methanoperedens nitroreducens]|uniref:Uncharacterized protein n=1 Tax=Candidatus Methanoperedens nitratireducens TaxID=1392998 RepID=A0A284VS37_9EURY|nr:hypothetical protein MNV_560043 [Candidatus Methanoperedens nitroreducens]
MYYAVSTQITSKHISFIETGSDGGKLRIYKIIYPTEILIYILLLTVI